MIQNFRRTKIWTWLRYTRALVQKLSDRYQIIRLAPLIQELTKTPDFPGSSASQKQWLEISLLGFQNTIPALLNLVEVEKKLSARAIPKAVEIFDCNEDVLVLRRIFDNQGSDKGSKHQYDLIYANIMANRKNEGISILEIGLGTNKTDTPSNMGKVGIPGASLRAWRDYFPHGIIVGCDIDKRILFEEDRITTYELDQTSEISWKKFEAKSPIKKFDLVIDDGLHAPFPNLATVKHSLPLLSNDGILVIEDIMNMAIPVWQLLQMILNPEWEIQIIETKASNIVIIKRNA